MINLSEFFNHFGTDLKSVLQDASGDLSEFYCPLETHHFLRHSGPLFEYGRPSNEAIELVCRMFVETFPTELELTYRTFNKKDVSKQDRALAFELIGSRYALNISSKYFEPSDGDPIFDSFHIAPGESNGSEVSGSESLLNCARPEGEVLSLFKTDANTIFISKIIIDDSIDDKMNTRWSISFFQEEDFDGIRNELKKFYLKRELAFIIAEAGMDIDAASDALQELKQMPCFRPQFLNEMIRNELSDTPTLRNGRTLRQV